MTGPDFRAARKSLGLTIEQAGALLDRDERTVRRWEHGTPPRYAAIIMTQLLATASAAGTPKPVPPR